ncbi:alpha/beta fold hydrolase [Flavobacteriales bacterium]|jgi:esterase|nr:alpha/beta fold hydrolase [Flavobacteriales bacterium]
MKLNFKKFGEGNPIFILHGLFGSLDNWQTLGKKIAENNTVYLVDLRNHGKSPHSDSFSYLDMVNDVAELIEDEGLEKVTIIGHSMGGKTAMTFAAEYPQYLNKLIVVDIAPKNYPPHHQEIIDALYSLDLPLLKSRREADEVMSKSIKTDGTRLFLLKNLNREKEGGYSWKMNLDMLSKEIEKVIDITLIPFPIQIPTLFIRGGDSGYILDSDFDKIEALFPSSDIETIEGSGHWVHAEKPKELLELISEFLD